MLTELGSHSTALSVNDDEDRFQRLAAGHLFADVTNAAIEGIEDLAEIPVAYGLPRDEGSRLPYVVPEYEDTPIYDHERLPSVTAESLVGEELTVRAFDALESPPSDLPGRETGLQFQHSERDEEGDIEYDLAPTSELEHIAEFTGPQLSFEFDVPQAVEDDFAGRMYDSPVDGDEAVYVHAGGAYTTEVRDTDDEVGAYRVNPDRESESGVRMEKPETGKAPLSEFLADVSEETRTAVAAQMAEDDAGSDDGGTEGSGNAVQGLERALAAVVESARKAAERARDGDRGNTDRQLKAVADRLERVETRLTEASDDLPDPLSNAARQRQKQANRRVEQARNAEKL